MKFFLTTIILLFYGSVFSQQIFSGKLTDENDFLLTSVLVINVTQNKQIYSNSLGGFSIEASKGDEIRFVKNKYERVSVKVMLDKNTEDQHITMIRIPEVIEEVKIVKLTGDLSKDSKSLTKINKVDILQKEIGLPKPPEIMREKAPELKDAVAIGLPAMFVDVDALYKVISGDARRMRAQYKFDDRERYIKWLRDRIDPNYFTEANIPEKRINEFLEFSFLENPAILQYIKKKNINGAVFYIDKTLPKFIERMEIIK